MEKIYIVKYAGHKIHKKADIFKSESELLKCISGSSGLEILEYELKSTQTSDNYLASMERDKQLKTILGDLSQDEVEIAEFIDKFKEVAPDGVKIRKWNRTTGVYHITEKEIMLNKIKAYSLTKKDLAKFLVKQKRYFMTLCDDIDWYVAILKIHNFRDHVYDQNTWDRTLKRYIKVDNATDIIKKNFKLAKVKLKSK